MNSSLFLNINPLSCTWFAHSWPFYKLPFDFVACFSSCAQLFSLMSSYIFLSSLLLFFLSYPENLPRPISRSTLPMFSTRSFIVLGIMHRGLIHYVLIYVWWCRIRVQLHSFGCPGFPAPFVGETLLPTEWFWHSFQQWVIHIHEGVCLGTLLFSIAHVCLYASTTLIVVAL